MGVLPVPLSVVVVPLMLLRAVGVSDRRGTENWCGVLMLTDV